MNNSTGNKDGSGPPPPDEYGPPSAHYYRNKRAADRAYARELAGRKQAAQQYLARRKVNGKAYARKFNNTAK